MSPIPHQTRVGILQTGQPPRDLQARFGTYASMMERMLGEGFVCETFDVTQGQWPDHPEACSAYLVTGSSAGVYDDLPWIAVLEDFLRRARGKAKLIGICFGHQIMAQAFGGTVTRSEHGWGLGLQTYDIVEPPPWMNDAGSIAIAVSHQDQVIAAPTGSRTIGGNAFAPIGILAYENDEGLSFQCHPEFDPAFAAALIEAKEPGLPRAAAATLIASLSQPNDRDRLADWIRRYIER